MLISEFTYTYVYICIYGILFDYPVGSVANHSARFTLQISRISQFLNQLVYSMFIYGFQKNPVLISCPCKYFIKLILTEMATQKSFEIGLKNHVIN